MIKHLVTLFILAGIAVLLPLPFSVLDIFTFTGTTNVFDTSSMLKFLADFSVQDTTLRFYLNFFGSIIFETLWAIPTFLLSYKLTNIFIKRESTKKKLEEITTKFKKQSDFIVLIAAATPFPFTLTIYAAGALNYSLKRMTIVILIGRIIKYSVLLALPYFTGFETIIFLNSLTTTDLVLGGVLAGALLSIYIINYIKSIKMNKLNLKLLGGNLWQKNNIIF